MPQSRVAWRKATKRRIRPARRLINLAGERPVKAGIHSAMLRCFGLHSTDTLTQVVILVQPVDLHSLKVAARDDAPDFSRFNDW